MESIISFPPVVLVCILSFVSNRCPWGPQVGRGPVETADGVRGLRWGVGWGASGGLGRCLGGVVRSTPPTPTPCSPSSSPSPSKLSHELLAPSIALLIRAPSRLLPPEVSAPVLLLLLRTPILGGWGVRVGQVGGRVGSGVATVMTGSIDCRL